MMTKQTILRADPGPLPSQAILMFELGLASSVKCRGAARPAFYCWEKSVDISSEICQTVRV